MPKMPDSNVCYYHKDGTPVCPGTTVTPDHYEDTFVVTISRHKQVDSKEIGCVIGAVFNIKGCTRSDSKCYVKENSKSLFRVTNPEPCGYDGICTIEVYAQNHEIARRVAFAAMHGVTLNDIDYSPNNKELAALQVTLIK